MKNRPFIAVISCITAIAFTVYITLDTFVISHVYSAVPESESNGGQELSAETQVEASEGGSATDFEDSQASAPVSAQITDSSYEDGNISITITDYREDNTDIHVADITLSSPEYLKTALAKGAYGKNVTASTSEIAEENDAILAINGDYYGVQESGYVIRNGILYRDTSRSGQEDLAIYSDGSMEIINEDNITAGELLERGVYNLLSFGPGLIENGEITVSENDEVAKAMTSNPRTALGIIDDLHYVFVVADGRTDESNGLSLYELAGFMKSLGATTAYNLDGGGSSTMVFNGDVINNPTSGSSGHGHGGHSRNSGNSSSSEGSSSSSSERSVSDIVYIGY